MEGMRLFQEKKREELNRSSGLLPVRGRIFAPQAAERK